MGHLINPITFRLGHIRSWEDFWYIKNLYYSEFIHSILKLRNYIYFYFIKQKVLNAGYGLCKLNIFKFNKILLIKLFIYHIELQKVSYKFINNLYRVYYKVIRQKEFIPYKNYFDIHNSDLFILIFIFIQIFFFKNLKYISRIFFNKFKFKKDKLDYLKNYQLKNLGLIDNNLNEDFSFFDFFLYLCRKINFQKYNNSFNFYLKWKRLLLLLSRYKIIEVKEGFLTFYNSFYIYMLVLWKSSLNLKNFNMRVMIYKHIYIYLSEKLVYNYIIIINNYFSILIKFFLNIIRVKFKYFFVSNKGVTSFFLTRYIALKLKKKYNLFNVLNPLKKELNYISKKTRLNYKIYNIDNYKEKFNIYIKKEKKKFFFFLFFFYSLYNLIYFMYYNKNFIWISFNIYLYKQYINKYYFNNYSYLFFKKFYILKLIKYMLIKFKYKLFFYWVNKNYFKIIKKFLNLKFFNNFYFFKVQEYTNKILFIKYILNNALLINFKLYIKVKTDLLLLSKLFFNFYLNFIYIKYLWLKYIEFNKHNIRNIYKIKYKSILMGYKISFKGRFSRKQRASSLWFHKGKVPLNSINLNIDYNFITIPLKNSLVSIKLWLYINKGIISKKYIMEI